MQIARLVALTVLIGFSNAADVVVGLKISEEKCADRK
jgi:hypothetical protein